MRKLGLITARCIILLGGIALDLRAALDENSERRRDDLAAGWQFHQGAIDPRGVFSQSDRSWEPVRLPHTWNAEDGQDGKGDYYRGDGWYRRILRVDSGWQGKRVYLQFDGANRTAEVFLNGAKIGEHRGGTARFRFDITSEVKIGGDNLLAVRVNNDPHDNIIPVSADFTFCGGLYRSVSLIATDPVHIDLMDYAGPGVYVYPEAVSRQMAKLDVAIKLSNDTNRDAKVEIRTTLLDADGQVVCGGTLEQVVFAHDRGEVRRRLLVRDPHLWNGTTDPYLYRLHTEVLVGNDVRDVVTLPVGIRFFSVDPEKGLSLNGVHLDLHGVCRHQERKDKGWAITEDDERSDFRLIEELGANAVRESHYQQSQYWQDLGDENGIIYWAELGFVNEVVDSPTFFQNAKQQLRELIRQNLHHPSILFWSIGNETFVRDRGRTPPDTNERLLAELAAVAREEDPSRISTYASNGDVTEVRAAIPDAVAFNQYFGWYHDMPDDFAAWLDRQHRLRPDLCVGMSEFGAGANPAQHARNLTPPVARGQWHPEEWQSYYHEIYWRTLSCRPWVWCKFVWCMFDFASDGRDEGGHPGINDKGLVSQDRKIRKDAYFFYQANWSSKPVLHLTSRRATPRQEERADVKAYSNCETVELWINGHLAGSQQPDDMKIVEWHGITLQPGINRIEVRGWRRGNEICDACAWLVSR